MSEKEIIDMVKYGAIKTIIEEVNTEASRLREALHASAAPPITIDSLVSVNIELEPKEVDSYVAREIYGEDTLYISGAKIRNGVITLYIHKDADAEDDPFLQTIDTRLTMEIWEVILLNEVLEELLPALRKEKEGFNKYLHELRKTGLLD